MKLIRVKFSKDSTTTKLYKSKTGAADIKMSSVSYNFCKEACKPGDAEPEQFYAKGICDMTVAHYFGAIISESDLDGRSKLAKSLPWYTVSIFIDTYKK